MSFSRVGRGDRGRGRGEWEGEPQGLQGGLECPEVPQLGFEGMGPALQFLSFLAVFRGHSEFARFGVFPCGWRRGVARRGGTKDR